MSWLNYLFGFSEPTKVETEEKIFLHKESGYIYLQELSKFSDGTVTSNIYFDGAEQGLNLNINPETMNNFEYIGNL